jgi:hypothetical protein
VTSKGSELDEINMSLEAIIAEINDKCWSHIDAVGIDQTLPDDGTDAYVPWYPSLLNLALQCQISSDTFRFFCHLLIEEPAVVMNRFGLKIDCFSDFALFGD